MPQNIQIWRMPHQETVEFVYVRSLNVPIPRQVSFDCKLVYFERGAKRFRYRHNACTAACGDLLFIPPGEAYEADAPDDATAILRILHLPEAVFADLLPNNRTHRRVGGVPLPPFVSDPRVIQRFRRLHQKPDTFASELEQQTQLLLLLEALQTPPADQDHAFPAPRLEEGAVRCLKQYIEAHYAEKITLAQLAHITGLNAAYLCRLFTQAVGMPPHAYQVAVRIDRALSLLCRGISVGQVAQQTGFYDQAHFTRHFRRFLQMPPAQYARQVKNVQDISPA